MVSDECKEFIMTVLDAFLLIDKVHFFPERAILVTRQLRRTIAERDNRVKDTIANCS
jgi:hypothetical protein